MGLEQCSSTFFLRYNAVLNPQLTLSLPVMWESYSSYSYTSRSAPAELPLVSFLFPTIPAECTDHRMVHRSNEYLEE